MNTRHEQAQRLQRALGRMGIYPRLFASHCGISVEHARGYLDGVLSLEDYGHAAQIARCLHVSTRWLLTGMPSHAAERTIVEFEQTEAVKMLSEKDRQTILELLSMLPGADELPDRDEQQ